MPQEWCLDSNILYLISPCGLGDTMILCGFRDALVKQYGSDVCYIVKPSHECIMKMYGITNYIVNKYDENELRQLANRNTCMSPGELIVAHPSYCANRNFVNGFYAGKFSFLDMYRSFLGLSNNVQFVEPKYYPEISAGLAERLGKKKVEDIVLIAPEMNSYFFKQNIVDYFEEEIKQQIDLGNEVILNSINEEYEMFQNLKTDMTLEELVALAIRCKKVVTARSGLSDLIYFQVREMEVIYPSQYYMNMYNLNVDFGARQCVKAKIAQRECVLKKYGYKKCAIYGMGYIGGIILQELATDGYQIDYVIDRRAKELDIGISAFHPDEKLPKADIMIVAVENGTEEIMEQIEKEHGVKTINYRYLFGDL